MSTIKCETVKYINTYDSYELLLSYIRHVVCLLFKCFKRLYFVMLGKTTYVFDEFICIKIPEKFKSIFNH